MEIEYNQPFQQQALTYNQRPKRMKIEYNQPSQQQQQQQQIDYIKQQQLPPPPPPHQLQYSSAALQHIQKPALQYSSPQQLEYSSQQQNHPIAHIYEPYLQNIVSHKQQKHNKQKDESVSSFKCTYCVTPTTFKTFNRLSNHIERFHTDFKQTIKGTKRKNTNEEVFPKKLKWDWGASYEKKKKKKSEEEEEEFVSDSNSDNEEENGYDTASESGD